MSGYKEICDKIPLGDPIPNLKLLEHPICWGLYENDSKLQIYPQTWFTWKII